LFFKPGAINDPESEVHGVLAMASPLPPLLQLEMQAQEVVMQVVKQMWQCVSK